MSEGIQEKVGLLIGLYYPWGKEGYLDLSFRNLDNETKMNSIILWIEKKLKYFGWLHYHLWQRFCLY